MPHGKQTDFYSAIKAEDGAIPIFSLAACPDRATCNAAAKAIKSEMGDRGMSDIRFDGIRMIRAGFEPILDSGAMSCCSRSIIYGHTACGVAESI